MPRYTVLVTEHYVLSVEADSPEQIKHWWNTEGAGWADQHAEQVECDDKIISIEEES